MDSNELRKLAASYDEETPAHQLARALANLTDRFEEHLEDHDDNPAQLTDIDKILAKHDQFRKEIEILHGEIESHLFDKDRYWHGWNEALERAKKAEAQCNRVTRCYEELEASIPDRIDWRTARLQEAEQLLKHLQWIKDVLPSEYWATVRDFLADSEKE